MNTATSRPKVVQLSLFRVQPADETGIVFPPAFFNSKSVNGFKVENLLLSIGFEFDDNGRISHLPGGWRIRKFDDDRAFHLIDNLGVIRGEGNDIIGTHHRVIRFQDEFLGKLAGRFNKRCY